ncbi:hypothetical protein GE09DRAFT_1101803 [Coniochaeta sp. 2T2.1]|nr:hypothetical protein GE09DRAFT_1101803 [Coniochaeta sp. 2T2.1]
MPSIHLHMLFFLVFYFHSFNCPPCRRLYGKAFLDLGEVDGVLGIRPGQVAAPHRSHKCGFQVELRSLGRPEPVKVPVAHSGSGL